MKTIQIVVLSCLLALTGPLGAQETPISAPLAEFLPADAVLYVGWAGQTEAMSNSALGQILASDQMGELWGLLAQAAGEPGPEGAMAFEMVEQLLTHEFAVAVYPPVDAPTPGVFMIADLQEAGGTFVRHLSQLMTASQLPATTAEEDYWVYDLPDGQTLVVTLDEVGRVTLRYGLVPVADQVMAEDAGLGASLARLAEGQMPQAIAYLDIAMLRSIVNEQLPPAAPEPGSTEAHSFSAFFFNQENINHIWEQAGLAEATSAAFVLHFDGPLMRFTGRLESPSPHDGLLAFYRAAPLTDEDLAVIPADASVAFAMNLSLADILSEIETVMTGLDMVWENGQFMADYEESMAAFAEEAGFELETLFASLGDTWTFAHAPSQGGLISGSVLTVEVADEAEFGAILDMLEGIAQREGVPVRSMGEIRYIVEPSSGYSPTMIAPAWMVHEGRLYVALWPQVLETVLASDAESITASEAFQAARASIPEGAISLTYVDTPAIMRQAYGFILLAGTAATSEMTASGLPIDQSYVPSLATLERFLTPEISACYADETGISFECSGAMPTISMLLNLHITPMAVPGFVSARRQARVGATMSNLRGMHTAVMMYEVGEGRWPERFEDLIENNNIDARAFGPIGGPMPQYIDGELVGNVVYHYVRPTDSSYDDDILIWIESYEDFPGQVAYVTLDGWTQLIPREYFFEQLAAQEASPIWGD